MRVEQLYPLPADQIKEQLARYAGAELIWAQDEPANQGQWPFMVVNLLPLLDRQVRLISRPASASPATGVGKRATRPSWSTWSPRSSRADPRHLPARPSPRGRRAGR